MPPRMKEEVSGLPARRAALRLLDAVMRMGQPMDHVVQDAAKGLPSADRALAIAIAQEVLRWTHDLDLLIDSQTRLPLAEDAKARMVLRMALAQMLRLGTPPHAAIATALPMVEKGPRRLVHGVLGSLFRLQVSLPDKPTLPFEAGQRWATAWGDAMAEAASVALAEPPPLDLVVRDPATTGKWVEKLEGVSLMPGHIRLPRGAAIESLPGFDEGAWWVQDLAATLPVRLLGEGKGRTVLDLCAAPGGKTMQLAAAGWKVTALDHSKRRAERLKANMERTGLAADLVISDVLTWENEQQFDAVLLDAPCSATGTFRRHPDVLYRIGDRQIDELVDLQAQMLTRAAGWVKPGGSLVYATCSLEPQEGEQQANIFLERHSDYTIAPAIGLPDAIVPGESGFVRTLPPMLAGAGGLDGFFAAHLAKTK